MKVIIDRFEGDVAIVEINEGVFATISKSLVPDAHEGDVINITIAEDETKKRKEKITDLMNDLFVD